MLALMAGCSSSNDKALVPNPAPPVSTNAAIFDPTTTAIPLPNILATATATDPLTGRKANTPMTPPEALAYINLHEVAGSNAVSGVNAPIYLQFSYPVDPATVTPANIRVFQLAPDAAGTENKALGFADVTGLFTFKYPAGGTDLWLFPSFPLTPGTRYLYVVSSRVKDAATGGAVIPSFYFSQLQSTTPLTGSVAALEPVRANVTSGGNILLSGYAKVMDDLIAASATTGIAARSDIALMGRFITSGAGFVAPDPKGSPSTLIPVETALRGFAAGPALGGLSGKGWDNSVTVSTTFTAGNPVPQLSTGAFWQSATGAPASTVPASIGSIVLGSINSAMLQLDPVVVAGKPASMDQTGVTGAYNPAAGVVQAYRDAASGKLTGYYHVPSPIAFVYIAPAAAAPAGGYPLVIYQHGITSQKETAIGLAQALTGAGFAILAIDLPMHGSLAIPSQQIAAGDSAAVIAAKQGGWGQTFMAVGAPLATRSNIQQAAFDLHRLELVVMTGGFQTLGAKAPKVTGMRFAGLSLGSIVGAYYLAGNTTVSLTGLPYSQATLDKDMKGLLSVIGAKTAYLIQASPAFGATIDAGLAAVGILKGTPTYHQFFQATQTVVDTVDPATMTLPLGAGLPSRLSGRIAVQEATSSTFDAAGNPTNGDLVITNPYTRYFGNALGGQGVLGVAAAKAIGPNFYQLAYHGGSAATAPVTFMYTLSATGAPTPKVQYAALSGAATGPSEGYFQFNQDKISHGGLLDPSQPVNAGLMQKQLVYFMGVTGTTLVVDPTVTGPALPIASGSFGEVRVPDTWTILAH
jgi:hypothetical protein